MSAHEHEMYAEWDGAYVTGALAPAERAAYERHLAGCAYCRRAVNELASLPGLLGRVGPAEVEALLGDDLEPPAGLEQRLLARAGHPRRRMAVRVGLGVAAAAAAAVAVLVPLVHTGRTPAVDLALHPRTTTPLTADVALTPESWGTQVRMTCRYADDQYAGRAEHSYALYVVDAAGNRTLVSRWHAQPGETARTTGASDLAVGEIGEVQLRDGTSGRLLLSAHRR